MTYAAIAEMAADADLLARCTACAVEQGEVSPEWWVQQQRWALAATPGWAAAYAYAQAALVVRPGWDAGVITDAAILTAVQQLKGLI